MRPALVQSAQGAVGMFGYIPVKVGRTWAGRGPS